MEKRNWKCDFSLFRFCPDVRSTDTHFCLLSSSYLLFLSMARAKQKKRRESSLHRRRRLAQARSGREAASAVRASSSQRQSRSSATTELPHFHFNMSSIKAIFYINLDGRGDRKVAFERRLASWTGTQVHRIQAVDPTHELLQVGAKFGIPTKPTIDNTKAKRECHKACVLSRILALQQLERNNVFPAMVCEDDVVIEKESRNLTISLPISALIVSLGHDQPTTDDSIARIRGLHFDLVMAKEGGVKSSTAAYIVPTRPKCQQLRKIIATALCSGLTAPLDGILFNSRSTDNIDLDVFLTKPPMFFQDSDSWSSIQSAI